MRKTSVNGNGPERLVAQAGGKRFDITNLSRKMVLTSKADLFSQRESGTLKRCSNTSLGVGFIDMSERVLHPHSQQPWRDSAHRLQTHAAGRRLHRHAGNSYTAHRWANYEAV